jgi:hypothetical protein
MGRRTDIPVTEEDMRAYTQEKVDGYIREIREILDSN